MTKEEISRIVDAMEDIDTECGTGIIAVEKSFGKTLIHLEASMFKALYGDYNEKRHSDETNRLFFNTGNAEIFALDWRNKND